MSDLILIRSLPQRGWEGLERVPLPMTAEDRTRVRRRVQASDGRAFALALPTGTTLHVGQVIYRDENKTYLVTAALENTLVVTPQGREQAARIGHLIGNLHAGIDVSETQIVTLWNAPLEARLRKEGFTVRREQRPFLGQPSGEHGHAERLEDILPPRYQGGVSVSPAPMGSAGLVYDDAGRVAWDRI